MTREEAIEKIKAILAEATADENAVCYVTSDDADALEMAIKTLEQTGWIPVSERLPEEYGEYMITWTTSNSIARKHGFLGTAEYELTGEYDAENNRFKGEWLLEDYVKYYKDVKVIAWMPLPEPYRAESKLDGDPIDTDKAIEHYEGTLEALKDIDLEDNT